MWAYESVFYQIYPFSLCGAPQYNDGQTVNRISKITEYIKHIKELDMDAVYFTPVFESDKHGYDTRNFNKIDCRLGTNEDFTSLCKTLHKNDLRVVLDGVFNHVGRGFWAFQDVLQHRENSRYKDWFFINFSGNSNYNDGLWYDGWEGHFDLVKLNLRNNEVVDHIFDAIRQWIKEFDIDGLRLDVAYSLDKDFVRRLRQFCDGLKPDFFLVGEVLHGDYNTIMNPQMLHSVTNYECYKGLFSSFNSMNLFEIGHSMLRQFGPENWSLYRGQHLFNFVDNHDVSRISTLLTNKNHLKPIYGLLFSMPGIPSVYYGSEWGAEGDKKHGDDALRPYFEAPIKNDLSEYISSLSKAHKGSKALCHGDFKVIMQTNKQIIFERNFEDERVIVIINADENTYDAHFNANAGRARNLITGETHDFGGGSSIPPYAVLYLMVY